jgi:hypothetical protein
MFINRTGPFFGYFLLDQSKKVTRLPAGTGGLEVNVLPGNQNQHTVEIRDLLKSAT